jgi:hypothetical protein
MMKVLSGAGYTQARLAGIMNEMWAEHLGRLPNIGDTIYATGSITTNSLTGDIGLLIDENSEYINRYDEENQYCGLLPQIHFERLVDVVEGDGWMDNKNNENGGIE